MNIKNAKRQIKNAVEIYLMKNQLGDYCISIEKQRPILLLGAPGIGKTAIMEQIAGELGLNLVSYSMTHHTRQSAIGLPYIKEKLYGEKAYSVSEYTMSEIIASVYEAMESSKIKEGLLFLDEINCVSETLAPAMLQFLQYKVFGRHRLPEGWVVVSAGNPPEYNYSVREYDVATLDRLKKITVEPDYQSWKEYAYEKGIHPSILTYLDRKQTDFYTIQSSPEGSSFVTARGWEDLSVMIFLYEQRRLEVEEELIGQYLQHKQIAGDFALYYELFMRYKAKYDLGAILNGYFEDGMIEALRRAGFDERISFLGAALDLLNQEIKELRERDRVMRRLYGHVKALKVLAEEGTADFIKGIEQCIEEEHRIILSRGETGVLSREEKQAINQAVHDLQEYRRDAASFETVRRNFEAKAAEMKELERQSSEHMEKAFLFLEQVFGESQEMVIWMTNLTRNPLFTWYLSKFGCHKYYEHNQELLLYERESGILAKIEQLLEEEAVKEETVKKETVKEETGAR